MRFVLVVMATLLTCALTVVAQFSAVLYNNILESTHCDVCYIPPVDSVNDANCYIIYKSQTYKVAVELNSKVNIRCIIELDGLTRYGQIDINSPADSANDGNAASSDVVVEYKLNDFMKNDVRVGQKENLQSNEEMLHFIHNKL